MVYLSISFLDGYISQLDFSTGDCKDEGCEKHWPKNGGHCVDFSKKIDFENLGATFNLSSDSKPGVCSHSVSVYKKDCCHCLQLMREPQVELQPVAAFLSSQRYEGTGGEKCIDGITDGPDSLKSIDDLTADLCHTRHEAAPWLALDFGEEIKVSVAEVVLFPRKYSSDCHNSCKDRTRNVEIRLSDNLPTSADNMFSGGDLLGEYKGSQKVFLSRIDIS